MFSFGTAFITTSTGSIKFEWKQLQVYNLTVVSLSGKNSCSLTAALCKSLLFISLDHICFILTNVRVWNVWLRKFYLFVRVLLIIIWLCWFHIKAHTHKLISIHAHSKIHACSLNIIICWYLCILLYEFCIDGHILNTHMHVQSHAHTHIYMLT